MSTPFLPGTEVLFVKEVLLGLVVPWITMLPFVLVVIAAIDMIKEWLPSRLDYSDPVPPVYEEIGTIAGRNGLAFRVTDPWAVWGMSTPIDPRLFIWLNP